MVSVHDRRFRRSASFALAVAALLVSGPSAKSIAEELAEAGGACQLLRREIAVSGSVEDSFDDSLRRAGAPARTAREISKAVAVAVDINRDVAVGDQFHLRYERQLAAEGPQVGDGRVLWAEVVTRAKGTIAFHRFRPAGGVEQLWLAGAEAVATPSMRLPLDTITVSSGFGMRPDPFDGPPPGLDKLASMRGSNGSVGGGGGGAVSSKGATINVATARGIALGLAPAPGAKRSRGVAALFMHHGIDLTAPLGTPIYAASDGIVSGAMANGGYGNWLRIEHARNVATVYGHLSRYAAGIEAGVPVSQGQLIGFVGSTGRSTGPHLHFEILHNGAAVDPLSFPGIKRMRLQGADLERFRAQVTQAAAVRRSEGANTGHSDCSQ
jgi:murein DD-endopeptidase MepM/ murein hydrolase activator NlpD